MYEYTFSPAERILLRQLAIKNTITDEKGRACISKNERWDWYEGDEVSEEDAFRIRNGAQK